MKLTCSSAEVFYSFPRYTRYVGASSQDTLLVQINGRREVPITCLEWPTERHKPGESLHPLLRQRSLDSQVQRLALSRRKIRGIQMNHPLRGEIRVKGHFLGSVDTNPSENFVPQGAKT